MPEKDFQILKDHFESSIKQKIHPWDFEKNLGHQLKGSDHTYYLYLYYLKYVDNYEHDFFKLFSEMYFQTDLDFMISRDEAMNKASLRLLKYDALGFKQIKGSKQKEMNKYRKDMQKWEKVFEKIMSEDPFETLINWNLDDDNSLFKIAEAYEEKVRLENEDKLTLH